MINSSCQITLLAKVDWVFWSPSSRSYYPILWKMLISFEYSEHHIFTLMNVLCPLSWFVSFNRMSSSASKTFTTTDSIFFHLGWTCLHCVRSYTSLSIHQFTGTRINFIHWPSWMMLQWSENGGVLWHAGLIPFASAACRGMTGSYGSAIFDFLRTLLAVFQNVYSNLFPRSQYAGLSFHPYQCYRLSFQ